MPPSGTNPKDSSITTRVPSRVKSTSIDYAHLLNGVDPYFEVSLSDLLRVGLYCYLVNHWEEIPPEVTEDLSREFLQSEIDQMPSLAEGSA